MPVYRKKTFDLKTDQQIGRPVAARNSLPTMILPSSTRLLAFLALASGIALVIPTVTTVLQKMPPHPARAFRMRGTPEEESEKEGEPEQTGRGAKENEEQCSGITSCFGVKPWLEKHGMDPASVFLGLCVTCSCI